MREQKPHTSASGEQIKSFRDLKVWQKGHVLAIRSIGICRKLPNNEETRMVKGQLIRSVTSVPANIAEGYGSYSGKGFARYLRIARGSVTETEYWFYLLYDLKYVNREEYEELSENCRELIAMLSSFITKLG